MLIEQMYKIFPTDRSCVDYLEGILWGSIPMCPYCRSTNNTALSSEQRHHCNTCNTSFSVTVGTVLHNTKLDFQKWFLAVFLLENAKKYITSRQLAKTIQVTKDTAWSMMIKIHSHRSNHSQLFENLKVVDKRASV